MRGIRLSSENESIVRRGTSTPASSGAPSMKLSERLETDPSIFWITTKAEISSQAVLTPIWRVVGGPEAHALIPGSPEIAGGPLPSIEVGQARVSTAALTMVEGSGWRL